MRLSLILLLPLLLWAMQGDVSLQLEKKPRYFVSEKIVMQLRVMTTGFSVGDVHVDSSGLKDLIIVAPQSASYVQSEEIGEESWQVAVYEYVLYPLRGGKIVLDPMEVTFTGSMGYGQPKSAFKKKTQPIGLEIASPEGIGDFVLSTPRLSLDVVYEPRPEQLKIGDAFERTITIQAKDVPDILLPSMAIQDNEALRIYRDEPMLSIEDDNAIRVEHETVIALKAGDITMPEQRVYWYDTAHERVHTEVVPSFTFQVTGLPDVKGAEEEGKAFDLWLLLGTLLYTALILILLVYIVLYEKKWIVHLPEAINPRRSL